MICDEISKFWLRFFGSVFQHRHTESKFELTKLAFG